MGRIIRLTESDLHRIVKESVNRILRENAWGKYPAEDQSNAMLDMNINTDTDGAWADAYKRNDPMVKNIDGTTLRHMMNRELGNNIKPN